MVKSSNKKINYKEYLTYILGKTDPLEVEKIFQYKQELIDQKYTEDQANERLLRLYATPENVPLEVWMSLGEENGKEVKDEDDFSSPSYSSSDSMKSYEGGDNDDFSLFRLKESEENFAKSSKIEKIGGSLELWPKKRVKSMVRENPEETIFSDMMNCIDITTAEKYQEMMDQTKYVIYDRIGLDEIKESVPIETDAIVMDPPLDEGMDAEELAEIFRFFKTTLRPAITNVRTKKKKKINNNSNEPAKKPSEEEEYETEEEEEAEDEDDEDDFMSTNNDEFDDGTFLYGNRFLNRNRSILMDDDEVDYDAYDENGVKKKKNKKVYPCVFIFVWSKPNHLAVINEAATRAGLLFCDTVVVETLDGKAESFKIKGKNGFVNKSKMILIYRTFKIKNHQFVHQQNLDVAFGVCRDNGKSRGRLGTPQSAHEIAEKMLPSKKKSRIYVELWPTRMCPRSGWIFIDETC